ncbi:MAG: NAD(P)-dependent oxidoreductase [Planctomycetota bacterium]|jgi:D-3-phosphoglycerate dehydrogenase
MKVLIADKLSAKAVSDLEKLGAEVTVNPELTADDLAGSLGDAEILIVRSTKVQAPVIEAAPNLSLIIRAGAGVNTIDLDCASSKGIYVSNCPGKNTDAVAELAIGLLIAADRRIVNAGSDMRLGVWNKKEYGKANGLKGRTLGIIGVGAIGKAVIKRAKGLEMNVIGWSRSLTEEKAGELDIGYCSSAQEVAKQADAISVHLAAKPETEHFIGKKLLKHMKDGSILINTSRGEVVDTAALKEAIEQKNLRVGLDVYENEPAASAKVFDDNELAAVVTGTPHIGASTNQAAEAVADEVVRIVRAYKETGKPINAVNIQQKSAASCDLIVRHYNRVGVLAGVLDELRNEEINIEEMENIIFTGQVASHCTLKLDSKPTDELMSRIEKDDNVIQVILNQSD